MTMEPETIADLTIGLIDLATLSLFLFAVFVVVVVVS
jgi:hypothetical protein